MTTQPTGVPPGRRAIRTALTPWRLLTPLGRGVLGLGVLAVAVGLALRWHEFIQLGSAAVCMVGLGYLWQALPGSPEVEMELRPDRLVEGGSRAQVLLSLRSGAAPMLFPRLVLPVGTTSVSARFPFLGPFARHEELVDLPALPRGVYAVGPVEHEKSDPVGLVSRLFGSGSPRELLVAPRIIDLPVFAGGLTNDLEGATSQQLSMSDLAFHALREYVPGDDLRHVHWRSSAKAGELLVRQYHETRRGHVTLLVDHAVPAYGNRRDFELAVSVAASIALRAVRDEFDTYLRCGSHLARGRTAVAITDAACRFAQGADDYLALAADAATEVPGTGLVIQVTGSARPLAELHEAAGRFDQGADWLVVRADTGSTAGRADSARLREVSVPDLPALQDVLGRGLR